MRFKRPAVALATVALVSLAACGGGSGTSDKNSDNPAAENSMGAGGGAGAGKDATAVGPVEVPADAAQGGDITVMTAVAPATLDPTRTYYTDSSAIMSMVTRALTQYVYRDGDMVLVPDMATDLGTPNEDNTEWTFTLRDGLKYEDGNPVKAEDVAYAIQRGFAIEELPDGPTYQLDYFLDGDKYKGPFKDKAPYKGVVVDGNKITIKMSQPFADMDYYASFPLFTAIPQDKDTKEKYGDHPLATGPYKFEDYKPGSYLKLVKNDQWDPATDPGRIQTVDSWTFKFSEDTTKLENVILGDQGDGQTSLTYDTVTPPTYKKVQTDSPERLVTGTSPCTYMWYIDMRKITDLNVRKALGYAYPYQNAWKAAGEIEGVTRVGGTTLLPPGTAGRNNDWDMLGIQGVKTDPAKAQELLKQAGAENYTIKWYYQADVPESVKAKDEIVKGLKAAGFDPQPIASNSTTIRDDLSDPEAPVNVRGKGWCSDWPSGGSWFPAQWKGSLTELDGMPNPSMFNEADADAKQQEIMGMSPEEAAGAWGEFDTWMMETYYPAVNLGYAGTAYIHGSKIGGAEADTLRGMPTFTRMYITQ